MSDLIGELLDIYYSTADGWSKQDVFSKEKHLYPVVFDIEPEDAESINEVKSFKITYEISKAKELLFERK